MIKKNFRFIIIKELLTVSKVIQNIFPLVILYYTF